VELWVVGMRSGGVHATSWQQVLYWRLTGQHFRVSQSDATLQAQRILNIEPCVYFFIGRCEPLFGDSGIASTRPPADAALVAPFDTGGLALKRVVTTSPLSDSAKVRLVKEWSLAGVQFEAEFRKWGTSNYGSSSSRYSFGDRPHFHLVAEIDLRDDVNRSHAWTWEGRLPSNASSCSGILPMYLAISAARLEEYRVWHENEQILTPDEYEAHLKMIHDIWLDPGDFAASNMLNRELAGRDQW
jgi:hypothetical protein